MHLFQIKKNIFAIAVVVVVADDGIVVDIVVDMQQMDKEKKSEQIVGIFSVRTCNTNSSSFLRGVLLSSLDSVKLKEAPCSKMSNDKDK